MRATRAAKLFLALTGAAVLFQLALGLGAPWGELTMGGAFHGALPPRMRVVAFVSAGLLAGFGVVVAARAGLAFVRCRRASRWLIWLVVAYQVVGVVLNAATPSPRERAVWLPVTIVLTVCSLIVARAAPPAESDR